jgi:amidohydrolase
MDAKAAARKRLEPERAGLVELSHRIHANPELMFEEEKASAWLSEALDGAGFTVERGICDLPTAFIARAGSGPLNIAICAEYDALPGVGHACGHNIIAAMAVGAGLAAAKVADDVGLTVTVVGTPAEEGGGGKILLLDRGAFAGVHAAMMVHPYPINLVEMPIIAASMFDVHYYGKEAHASAFPELGINAADALTVAQTAIGLLRQHMRPGDRVHGIITKGGEAANIIPAHTSAHYMVRANTLAELDEINTKVFRCFEAGAIATGSRLEIDGSERPYAEMRHDRDLADLYAANFGGLGGTFPDPGILGPRTGASTDMGNISLAIPSIHPAIGLNSFPVSNHQPEFTAYCVTPVADQAVFDGALAMAWTVIDAAIDDGLRQRLLSGRSVA